MMNTEATDVGPIRVSENGRYFRDRGGRPFLWLGDTQWQLFRSFTLEEAETILQDRREKGFTVLQVMVTGVGDGTVPNLEGHTPWLHNDPATPNEAYFRQVDTVVELARQKGLILALYLCHNRQQDTLHVGNARAYARWVAWRYRDMPNILWAFVTKVPIADHLPLIRELAAGVQEGDGGVHLITYHPDPVRPALSSGEIHAESWLAFNMIQTWAYYEGIYGMVTRDYHRVPPKPVVMAEGAYEDETDDEYGFVITPLLARKQAYWSYLSGGFHTYGHSDCWRVPATWKAALDAPGAFQMGVLARLLTARRWWELVPDQRLLADQNNPGTTLNVAARSRSGDWALAYLSSPTRFVVRMEKLVGAGTLHASWIDPRTGVQTAIGTFPNRGTRMFAVPGGWEDAILLLEAAGGSTLLHERVDSEERRGS
jgi:hypothetical protein